MNKLWRILLVCTLMSLATTSWATDQLAKVKWSTHMMWAMTTASTEAAPYGLSTTMQAIIYKESTACKFKDGIDPYSHSNGCGQLTIRTANMIWKSCEGIAGIGDCATKSLSIKVLKSNDYLNIHISAEALQYCYWFFEGNLHRAIVCYNKGEVKTKSMTDKEIAADSYLHDVLDYIRQIQALPKDTN